MWWSEDDGKMFTLQLHLLYLCDLVVSHPCEPEPASVRGGVHFPVILLVFSSFCLCEG